MKSKGGNEEGKERKRRRKLGMELDGLELGTGSRASHPLQNEIKGIPPSSHTRASHPSQNEASHLKQKKASHPLHTRELKRTFSKKKILSLLNIRCFTRGAWGPIYRPSKP